MAAVSRAVDSTMCGQLPRCIHMDTLATAWCWAASSRSSGLSLSTLEELLPPMALVMSGAPPVGVGAGTGTPCVVVGGAVGNAEADTGADDAVADAGGAGSAAEDVGSAGDGAAG
ncbi:hypothetical protein CH063_08920 [Colletotrichum higginsianum]|uniref:Uncharacterized protein n=1 Tax=Colletotrichum higginsianum (strain IMI 349063) TaxID=759273 RepID=H1VBM5_COLHI|nr:hypothetical protein CH063_08920 [Colletotrichum higginsianum]